MSSTGPGRATPGAEWCNLKGRPSRRDQRNTDPARPMLRDLVAELLANLNEDRPCVYCAVVDTRGSTPQKAGAAMLVFPDGSQCGTLGGGCVEAEVKQRALRVLAENEIRPGIFTFNLDSNYGWDDGLICGGRMTVLADPLPEPAPANEPHRP